MEKTVKAWALIAEELDWNVLGTMDNASQTLWITRTRKELAPFAGIEGLKVRRCTITYTV